MLYYSRSDGRERRPHNPASRRSVLEVVSIARPAVTRSEWVYETIKESILSGKIGPGERLVADALARELGTSVIPVREALRRLEAERLVENTPFVGARVAPVRLEELEELFAIRLALEPVLARSAVRGVTPETLSRLEELVNEMDRYVQLSDGTGYSRTNYEFHRTLYEQSPWKELHRIVSNAWDRSARSRWVFVQSPKSMEISQAEHRAMLEALRRGDENEVERLTRMQKQRAFSDYLAALKGWIGRQV